MNKREYTGGHLIMYVYTNQTNVNYAPMRNQLIMSYAEIQGSELAPHIKGMMTIIDVPGGAEVFVEVVGLPHYEPAKDGKAPIGPHGYHIHEEGNCTIGDPADPYKDAGSHWNPWNQPHGNHAGDFPVLFSNDGYARMCFFTNKFNAAETIGKSIIIHENPDDFRSQPSGDSGKRIACGVIQAYR